jgi:hypothetical protein
VVETKFEEGVAGSVGFVLLAPFVQGDLHLELLLLVAGRSQYYLVQLDFLPSHLLLLPPLILPNHLIAVQDRMLLTSNSRLVRNHGPG